MKTYDLDRRSRQDGREGWGGGGEIDYGLMSWQAQQTTKEEEDDG